MAENRSTGTHSKSGRNLHQPVQEAVYGFLQVIQRMEKTVILRGTAHFGGGRQMQENCPLVRGMIRAARQMEQPVVEEIADKPARVGAQADRQSWMDRASPVQ